MNGSWRSDPATPGVALFGGLVLVGFVVLGVGWKVAAASLDVAVQVPALVSGALGGLALVVVGAGLGAVHLSRRWSAAERVATDALLAEAAALAAAAVPGAAAGAAAGSRA